MIRLVLASILAFLLMPATAQAFIFLRGSSYSQGARPVKDAFQWTNRRLTFVVNTDQTVYGGSLTPDVSAGEFLYALNLAVAQWNGICGSNVAVVLDGTTSSITAVDGVNVVSWDNRTTGEGNQINSTSTLAVAWNNSVDATRLFSECDIAVNGNANGTFAVDGRSSSYDLVGVLAHEIGHCLGLDHTIELPTYTSTNPILVTATMSSALSAGDIGFRTISQDEIDAMECVYPTNYPSRAGKFCTSYHGTNGGAAISGTVTGGPDAERACGVGTSSAVTTSRSVGGGCVLRAVAADGTDADGPLTLGWTFLVAVFILGRSLYRRIRKAFLLVPLLLLLGGSQAVMALPAVPAPGGGSSSSSSGGGTLLEIAYQRTSSKPALMNGAAAMTIYEGTYPNVSSGKTSTFKGFDDVSVTLSFLRSRRSTLGVYYKMNLEQEIVLKGYNAADTLMLTKTSALDGWIVGLVAGWYLLPVTARRFNPFFEVSIGAGPTKFRQTIVEDPDLTAEYAASAFAMEMSAFVGAKFPLYGSINFLFKGGYSRFQSNYFSVESKSGNRFSNLTVENRLALQSGEEVRLVRGGLNAQAGLGLAF